MSLSKPFRTRCGGCASEPARHAICWKELLPGCKGRACHPQSLRNLETACRCVPWGNGNSSKMYSMWRSQNSTPGRRWLHAACSSSFATLMPNLFFKRTRQIALEYARHLWAASSNPLPGSQMTRYWSSCSLGRCPLACIDSQGCGGQDLGKCTFRDAHEHSESGCGSSCSFVPLVIKEATSSSIPGWNLAHSTPQLTQLTLLQSCRASIIVTNARTGASTKFCQSAGNWSRRIWNLMTLVLTMSGLEHSPLTVLFTVRPPSCRCCRIWPKIRICSLVPRQRAGMTICSKEAEPITSWLGASTRRSANASTLMFLGYSKKCMAMVVMHSATPLQSASTSEKEIWATGLSSSWKCSPSSSNWSGSMCTGPGFCWAFAVFLALWRSWAPCWVWARLAMEAVCSSAVTIRKMSRLASRWFEISPRVLALQDALDKCAPQLHDDLLSSFRGQFGGNSLVRNQVGKLMLLIWRSSRKDSSWCCSIHACRVATSDLVDVVIRHKSTNAAVPQVNVCCCAMQWSVEKSNRSTSRRWQIFRAILWALGSSLWSRSPSNKVQERQFDCRTYLPTSRTQWWLISKMV